MASFAQFLLSQGEGLIAPELVSKMGVVAFTDSFKAGLEVGGGHGLWCRDRHGVIGRCRGGNTLGYRGMLCLFYQNDRVLFALVNADSETADYEQNNELMIKSLKIPPVTGVSSLSIDKSRLILWVLGNGRWYWRIRPYCL